MIIEIFYNHNRIASHKRLYGRKGQYSTIVDHMPEERQKYLEWNGERYREWARQIGGNTFRAIDAILASKRVEQQAYRSCMGLLKMADKYSNQRLEDACEKALSLTACPSYKNIKNIIATDSKQSVKAIEDTPSSENRHGIVRGAIYYGGILND